MGREAKGSKRQKPNDSQLPNEDTLFLHSTAVQSIYGAKHPWIGFTTFWYCVLQSAVFGFLPGAALFYAFYNNDYGRQMKLFFK